MLPSGNPKKVNMYSEIVEGKVLDFHFKKRETDTLFYIGNILIGQLFKHKRSWCAVSSFENMNGPIYGFANRLYAAEYLLKIFRRIKKEEVK